VLAGREPCYAVTWAQQAFYRAVGLAEDHFTEGQANDEPCAVHNFDTAELAGVIGARYRDLARHHPTQAQQSARYIERALEQRHPTQARNRVFDLIGLARTHLIMRAPDRACQLINQAVPVAQTWAAGRVGVKLRDFHRESGEYRKVAVVRETRDIINGLLCGQL
jgi:hypothetical protein